MSETIGAGPVRIPLPTRSYQSTGPASASAPPTTVIPADAAAPVWQPWTQTQSKALSVLKTQITAALADFERAQADAQRVYDGAIAIAAGQVHPLEAAAWAAWHKYMDEAGRVNEAIMTPATKAYESAMEAAHLRLVARLDPVEHAYARAAYDATWTKGLTEGGATIGRG